MYNLPRLDRFQHTRVSHCFQPTQRHSLGLWSVLHTELQQNVYTIACHNLSIRFETLNAATQSRVRAKLRMITVNIYVYVYIYVYIYIYIYIFVLLLIQNAMKCDLLYNSLKNGIYHNSNNIHCMNPGYEHQRQNMHVCMCACVCLCLCVRVCVHA